MAVAVGVAVAVAVGVVAALGVAVGVAVAVAMAVAVGVAVAVTELWKQARAQRDKCQYQRSRHVTGKVTKPKICTVLSGLFLLPEIIEVHAKLSVLILVGYDNFPRRCT